MTALSFDPIAHEYRLNGFVVPSVTQALSIFDDFSGIPKDTLEYARDRGTAAHTATALYDQSNLDLSSVDPVVKPYLDAWMKFCDELNFSPDHIEARVYSKKYQYAGTLDRVGTIKHPWGLEDVILDIKTTAVISASTGPQLAAYDQAGKESIPDWPKKMPRYTVQLRNDGSYRMHCHEDKADLSVFLAALTVHNFRRAKCK